MLELTLHSFNFRFHYACAPMFDVYSLVDKALQYGFGGLNVSAYGPDYRELSGADPHHLRRLRAKLESNGLSITLETNGTDPEHLKNVIALAGSVGARSIRTYTRPKHVPARHSADREDGDTEAQRPQHAPSSERISQAIADLILVGPLAEEAGVRILVENHEELAGEEVATIVREVDHHWIRALYDYGNSMVFLEEPLMALESMRPWIKMAHLKDHVILPSGVNGMERASILGVPVGCGNIPVVEITRQLVVAGVDTICFENVWAYRTPLREQRGSAVLGKGVFAYGHPPYDPAVMLPNVEAEFSRDPKTVLAMEENAFTQGIAWTRRAFAEARLPI